MSQCSRWFSGSNPNDRRGSSPNFECSPSTPSKSCLNSPKSTWANKALWKFHQWLAFIHLQKQQPSPIKTSPHLEILQYIEEHSDCSVQEFWRASRKRFPNLAKLAQQILSVVASSSPVERVFSIGGYMMRPHRKRLSPTTLKFLV